MAGILPTATAEKVYDVLMKHAEASPNYYKKELFIYQFGVLAGKRNKMKIACIDGKRRYFVCSNKDSMILEGPGANRVNPILKKLAEQIPA